MTPVGCETCASEAANRLAPQDLPFGGVFNAMRPSGARSRVVSGIALIVAAVGLGLMEVKNVAGQANRDFAFCGPASHSRECQALSRPISVVWTRSIGAGAQTLYEVTVQTGKHTQMVLTDLTGADVAPLQGLTSIEVRYRNGRPVALIWPDGMPVQIPFAVTQGFWMTVLAVVLIGIAGVIILWWGIVRAARARTVRYAYP